MLLELDWNENRIERVERIISRRTEYVQLIMFEKEKSE